MASQEKSNSSRDASPIQIEKDGPLGDSDNESIRSLVGKGSLGVRRIEAITAQFTKWDFFALMIGIFLVSYAYGLDGTVRWTYQPIAANDLHDHSLIATISVARSTISAATQPVIGKLCDVIGRAELVYLAVFFYVIGTIVEATAPNIGALAAGSILYQLGYTIIQLLVEVLIADATSMQDRLLFSFVPSIPFLVNTWISGNVASTVLAATTWRWGFGMWAIIFPVSVAPLLITLLVITRRAKQGLNLENLKSPFQQLGAKGLAIEMFWQLDLVGMVLVLAIFGLILVPLTLAGGITAHWKTAGILVPLVLGFICIPIFVVWEKSCLDPIMPFHLLKDRGVWGALGIAAFLNFSWYMQGDYLYTVLVVAYDQTIESSTRIGSLYTFVSVLAGLCVGILVKYIKQLKVIIVAGACMWTVAYGLLIRYRGGSDGASWSGIVGAQVLLGVGGGFFPITAMTSIQSCVNHEHLATITSLYLALYFVGSALGNCVSGVIWGNYLPDRLSTNLAPFNNQTMIDYVFVSPFAFSADYPFGTPERHAVVEAYKDCQKVLCIMGLCLTLPLICFALCTRNHTLGKEQTIEGAEKYAPENVIQRDNLAGSVTLIRSR